MTAAYSTQPIDSAKSAIAALAGDDNQTRYYAAWWLGKNQVQEACSVLCDALQDDRYRTEQGGYPLRRQAARALGQLKNPQALPALLLALSCSEDINLREAAVQAIAAIGDRQAIPNLIELLQSGSEQPYEAVIEALGTLQAWEARSLVEPFLQHRSERVQCAAARYLYLLTQEPQYIERIVQNLSHENMYLRWAAAFDLGAIGHLKAAQAIMAAKVADSLKLMNLKRILEALLSAEESNETVVQEKSLLLAAIDCLLLGGNGESSATGNSSFDKLDTVELLDRLNRAVTPLEAIPLIDTLSSRKTFEAIAPLIQKLQHHHPAISSAAVEGLVQFGKESVEPLIKAFLSCKDHGVQAYIVQALARIGDVRSLDLLIEVVGVEVANHCQGNVRRMAARGLGKIGSTSDDSSIINRCIEKLSWALLNVEDWALRYAAVVSLQEIATSDTKAIAEQALNKESDRVVKLRCQTALENWDFGKIKSTIV